MIACVVISILFILAVAGVCSKLSGKSIWFELRAIGSTLLLAVFITIMAIIVCMPINLIVN